MEKRKFENIGVESSLLGFGCMRFPVDKNGNINEAESMKMLDLAYSSGVTYFDTAFPYLGGKSEEFVGRALEKYPRKSYLLATKLPSWSVNTLEDVRKIFNTQLERLKTDYIDFYLLHSLSLKSFNYLVDLGAIEECEKLMSEGRIKFFGFSFHDNYDAFEQIINYRKWDFCQLQINYIDQNNQAGIKGLKLAESLGVPVIIMEPVKGGHLAILPEDVRKPFDKIDKTKSASSWAMRWVASQPNVKVILSGMSEMEQVRDNIKTFTDFKPMTREEFSAVDEVIENLKARTKNGCTACKYCMPCPKGVDIAGSFHHWNNYGKYENKVAAIRGWKFSMTDEKQPKNCIGCGKCEKMCPQKISIREDLKKVQAEFDAMLKE